MSCYSRVFIYFIPSFVVYAQSVDSLLHSNILRPSFWREEYQHNDRKIRLLLLGPLFFLPAHVHFERNKENGINSGSSSSSWAPSDEFRAVTHHEPPPTVYHCKWISIEGAFVYLPSPHWKSVVVAEGPFIIIRQSAPCATLWFAPSRSNEPPLFSFSISSFPGRWIDRSAGADRVGRITTGSLITYLFIICFVCSQSSFFFSTHLNAISLDHHHSLHSFWLSFIPFFLCVEKRSEIIASFDHIPLYIFNRHQQYSWNVVVVKKKAIRGIFLLSFEGRKCLDCRHSKKKREGTRAVFTVYYSRPSPIATGPFFVNCRKWNENKRKDSK